MKDQEITFKTQSALLPVLLESVNPPAMVQHCMEVSKQLELHINPSQKQIIITGDQPVCALGKQVQWKYHNQFPDIFWMMGHYTLKWRTLLQLATGLMDLAGQMTLREQRSVRQAA